MGEIRAHSLVRASADEEGDRFWSQPWSSQLIFTFWHYFKGSNLYLLFGTISAAAHSQSNFVTFNFEIFPRHLPKATTSSTDSTLDRATFYHQAYHV